MSMIFSVIFVAVVSLIAGFFSGKLYFSKQWRYLLFTVDSAGLSTPDVYYQAKLAETIRLWGTGKYYKILILSTEKYERGSLIDNIRTELLNAGINGDRIECHDGTVDLPHYVVAFDYATGEL